MTRIDRIAKRIVARSEEVQEAIYELWMKLYGNKIEKIKFPEKIHNSSWCMHHTTSKEFIKDSYQGLSLKFVNTALEIAKDKTHSKNQDAKNFLSELATVVYIPEKYHPYFEYIKKKSGKTLSIKQVYEKLNDIKHNEFELPQNIDQALDNIKTLSYFAEDDKEIIDEIKSKLILLYKQTFKKIFLK